LFSDKPLNAYEANAPSLIKKSKVPQPGTFYYRALNRQCRERLATIDDLKQRRTMGDFKQANNVRRKEVAEVVLSAKNFLSEEYSDARIAIAGAKLVSQDNGESDLNNL
jgi:hypothetical protein